MTESEAALTRLIEIVEIVSDRINPLVGLFRGDRTVAVAVATFAASGT